MAFGASVAPSLTAATVALVQVAASKKWRTELVHKLTGRVPTAARSLLPCTPERATPMELSATENGGQWLERRDNVAISG